MVKWSKLELEFLIRNSPHLSDAEGARQLSEITGKKFTSGAWTRMRNAIGLKKTRGTKNEDVAIEPGSPLDLAGATVESLLTLL